MSFRELTHRRLIPLSELTMIFGIVALCQPWIEFLHRYGATIVIIGLVGFIVLTKVPAPQPDNEDAA